MSIFNDNYIGNDNLPPGFEDKGIKYRYSGVASGMDSERAWIWSMREWPQSIQQAEIEMFEIKNQKEAHDNILRFQKKESKQIKFL